VSTAVRRTFTAQYPGSCGTCPAAIQPGDHVFYALGNEMVSGLDCCGDRTDDDLAPRTDHLAVDDEDAGTVVARAMPRGKTAADSCARCFQIPANNGACGCNY
jgi:hypothetical protein